MTESRFCTVEPGDVLIENTTFIRFINSGCCPQTPAAVQDAVSVLQGLILHNRVRICPDEHVRGFWNGLHDKGWAEEFEPSSFYWDFFRNPEAPIVDDESSDLDPKTFTWKAVAEQSTDTDNDRIVPIALQQTRADFGDADFKSLLSKTFNYPQIARVNPDDLIPSSICIDHFFSEDDDSIVLDPFGLDFDALRTWDLPGNWEAAAGIKKDSRLRFIINEVFRTNLYVLVSARYRIPYLPNSLRLPIVKYKTKTLQATSKIFSKVVVDTLADAERSRSERLNKLLETSRFSVNAPWIVRLYLDRLKDVKSPLRAIESLRKDKNASAFRSWVAKIDQHVMEADSQKVADAIHELEAVANSWSGSSIPTKKITGELINCAVNLSIGNPSDAAGNLLKGGIHYLRDKAANRHLLYLVSVGEDVSRVAADFAELSKSDECSFNPFCHSDGNDENGTKKTAV